MKERQAYAASQEDWQPANISKKEWRELARADLEDPEGGLRGSMEGEAARLYLHRATKEAEKEKASAARTRQTKADALFIPGRRIGLHARMP